MARNFAATWAQNRGGQQPDGRQRKDRSRYEHKGRGGFGDNRIAQEIQEREQFQQGTWADRGGQQRQDPAFQAQQGYQRQERPQQQQPDGTTAYTQSQSGQAMKPINQAPVGGAAQRGMQGYQRGGRETTQEMPRGYRDFMARPGPTTQEMRGLSGLMGGPSRETTQEMPGPTFDLPKGYQEMMGRPGPTTQEMPQGYQEMINRPTASQADRLREAMTAWGQKDQGRGESPASLMAREYGQERRTGKRLPQGYQEFTRPDREATQKLPQGYQEFIDQTRRQPDDQSAAERMAGGYGDQPDKPPDISRLIGSGYGEGTGTAPTDFQAPRSVDEALQQRLLQSLSTQAGVDDPVAAAQRADYEEKTRQARQQQIEELNRLGILRGGGDTAAILGQFDVGALRGQQQISADMATRQQEALNQALQFEQQRQTGELGRGQLSQQAQQMALDRELGRRELAAREGQMTGRFGDADTLAREEMDLRREQMEQQRELSLAELTGQVQGEYDPRSGQRTGTQTLAAQQLAQRQKESEAERGLRREELTGEIAGVGGPRRSLAAQELAQQEELAAAGLTGEYEGAQTLAAQEAKAQQELATAGLTGRYRGMETLGGRELRQEESQFGRELAQQAELAKEQRELSREELRGYTLDPMTGKMVRTMEGQRLGQEASQFEKDRALREAGITGVYGEDGAETLAARQAREQQELAVAGLTGKYGEEGADTLAAQEMAQREALATRGLNLEERGLMGQETLEARQAQRQSDLDRVAQELAIRSDTSLSELEQSNLLNRLNLAYGDSLVRDIPVDPVEPVDDAGLGDYITETIGGEDEGEGEGDDDDPRAGEGFRWVMIDGVKTKMYSGFKAGSRQDSAYWESQPGYGKSAGGQDFQKYQMK